VVGVLVALAAAAAVVAGLWGVVMYSVGEGATGRSSAAPACSQVPAAGLPDSWKIRVDTAGSYSVAVPDLAPISDGEGPYHRFYVTTGDVRYTVDWYDVRLAADPDAYLRELSRQILEEVPDERDVRRRPLEAAPDPTLELRYIAGDGHVDQTFRLILTEDRYYALGLSTFPNYDGIDRERAAFFDSFAPFSGCP
jgi:hypothetical protein